MSEDVTTFRAVVIGMLCVTALLCSSLGTCAYTWKRTADVSIACAAAGMESRSNTCTMPTNTTTTTTTERATP